MQTMPKAKLIDVNAMTGLVKIDRGIPVPDFRRGGGRNRKYPYAEMEVGDSFFCDVKFGYETARTGTKRYAPKRFTASKVDGGFRVWRVA